MSSSSVSTIWLPQIWPQSIHSGGMKYFTRKRAGSSLPSCSTSLTTNSFHSFWVDLRWMLTVWHLKRQAILLLTTRPSIHPSRTNFRPLHLGWGTLSFKDIWSITFSLLFYVRQHLNTLFHSLIAADGSVRVELMRNWFDNPHLLRQPGQMDAVIRGLIDEWPQNMDEWVSEDVTNHLFQRYWWKLFLFLSK